MESLDQSVVRDGFKETKDIKETYPGHIMIEFLRWEKSALECFEKKQQFILSDELILTPIFSQPVDTENVHDCYGNQHVKKTFEQFRPKCRYFFALSRTARKK